MELNGQAGVPPRVSLPPPPEHVEQAAVEDMVPSPVAISPALPPEQGVRGDTNPSAPPPPPPATSSSIPCDVPTASAPAKVRFVRFVATPPE